MATKKKTAANVPPIENPAEEQPTFTVEIRVPLTPDEVWAEVVSVSERLGIDKKMGIDLLQLTSQINESRMVVKYSYDAGELQRLVKSIIPVVMDLKAKAAQES